MKIQIDTFKSYLKSENENKRTENIYLYFLSFLNPQMAQVDEIIKGVRQDIPIQPTYATITMAADVLATQGARASAVVVLV